MYMRSLEITTVLAVLAPAAVAGPSTLILDDFDADPNDDAGGPRELSLSTYADPFGQGGSFEVDTGYNFGGDAGAVIFNSGAGAELAGEIIWNNGGNGLNLDTTALGLLGFELDFQFVDQDFECQYPSEHLRGYRHGLREVRLCRLRGNGPPDGFRVVGRLLCGWRI
jgi:hypothetical protein